MVMARQTATLPGLAGNCYNITTYTVTFSGPARPSQAITFLPCHLCISSLLQVSVQDS